jgi:UDP-N-acetyl-D-glucosamine dehydrogenase
MKIAVIGLGYVGNELVKSSLKAGHHILGIDSDEDTRIKMSSLESSHKFVVTTDFTSISKVEIVIIAVPTPLDSNREPDLSDLHDVLNSMQPFLTPDTLIINESTSYPGTLRNVIAARLGTAFEYVSAPERVDPGNAFWNSTNTPRLISGMTSNAIKRAKEFYSTICDSVIEVSSPEVAEAAKIFENTFRQVNIALVNEFAQIAEKFSISATEAITAAASKPFGFMPFLPGIGVGGHCIPIDPTYLSFAVAELGGSTKIIDVANDINLNMPRYVAGRIQKLRGGDLTNNRIQIAGISYKSNTSDIRESPAILLISELRMLGAWVTWHDPLVQTFDGETSNELSANIDLGLIVTPHDLIDFDPWVPLGSSVLDLSSTSTNFGWKKFL